MRTFRDAIQFGTESLGVKGMYRFHLPLHAGFRFYSRWKQASFSYAIVMKFPFRFPVGPLLLLFFSLPLMLSASDDIHPPTKGGEGGRLIRVTSLEGEGKGSLRQALWAKGRRIIVFEVGGVIDLEGRSLNIGEPFVTIAGQTAPSPGITLVRGGLTVNTHDVIVKHLRVRPGEAGKAKGSGWEADGISLFQASNVWVDHCSCTWATDENLSASGPRFEGKSVEDWRKNTSHRVLFSNNIIAEALSNSTHSKGEHSKGSLLHDNTSDITIARNLYASNFRRNPLAKGGVRAVIVNNWISNPGRAAIAYGLNTSEWKGNRIQPGNLVIVGNVLEHGPDTADKVVLFENLSVSPVNAWMIDNVAAGKNGQAVAQTQGYSINVSNTKVNMTMIDAIPSSKVKEFVASNAGARPWDRDEIDERIVRQALAGRGKIIDSEKEVGGYPKIKATRSGFAPADWNLKTMEKK